MPVTDPTQRAQLYNFLASAYLWPPTDASLEAAADEDFAALVGAYLGEVPRLALDELRRRGAVLKDVHMAWEELFRVPTKRYTKPFESVYREPYVDDKGRERRRLMGDCTAHVAQFYEAAGADFAGVATTSRLPDFIGAEVAFMHYLCKHEAAAIGRGDEAQATELRTLQRRFLAEHLVQWVEPFCDEVLRRDDTGYHTAVAGVLRAFVLADHRFVAAGTPDDITAQAVLN